MNKSARILLLIVALAGASFVSYMVYERTSQKPAIAKTTDTEQKTVQIAVVDRDLNRGAKITTQDLRMASYLEKSLPKGHFTDMTEAIGRIGGLVEARRQFEAACVRACLDAAGGNVSQAARLLGIDRTNLHKKIASLGLEARSEENAS